MELRLFIFFIDTVFQVIEKGLVVRIKSAPRDSRYDVLVFNSIWVVKNTIFYCREPHDTEEEDRYQLLIVVRLCAEVIQREFVTYAGSV